MTTPIQSILIWDEKAKRPMRQLIDKAWESGRTVKRMDRCDKHQDYRSTSCPDCLIP